MPGGIMPRVALSGTSSIAVEMLVMDMKHIVITGLNESLIGAGVIHKPASNATHLVLSFWGMMGFHETLR